MILRIHILKLLYFHKGYDNENVETCFFTFGQNEDVFHKKDKLIKIWYSGYSGVLKKSPKMQRRFCGIQLKRIYHLVICCYILTTYYLAVYLSTSQATKKDTDVEDNLVDDFNVQDKIKEALGANNGTNKKEEDPRLIRKKNVKLKRVILRMDPKANKQVRIYQIIHLCTFNWIISLFLSPALTKWRKGDIKVLFVCLSICSAGILYTWKY